MRARPQHRGGKSCFGWSLIAVHWGSAVLVFSLFALGLYMTGLSYSDAYYYPAPHYHKSFGMLLFPVILFWFCHRMLVRRPFRSPALKPWEKIASRVAHLAMLWLIFAIAFTGYLIPTAEGEPVEVFDWFSVPALLTEVPGPEDMVGDMHCYLSWVLMALVGLHASAALKHHFLHRDRTLLRMLGRD